MAESAGALCRVQAHCDWHVPTLVPHSTVQHSPAQSPWRVADSKPRRASRQHARRPAEVQQNTARRATNDSQKYTESGLNINKCTHKARIKTKSDNSSATLPPTPPPTPTRAKSTPIRAAATRSTVQVPRGGLWAVEPVPGPTSRSGQVRSWFNESSF